MDLGRKKRDQPRKDKLGANKQRTDAQSESTPQPKRMNLVISPRETEYIESSHPSILTRGTGTTTYPRSRHGISRSGGQPRSKRDSDDRRPCTPVPSLISSDTMSPPSISTISPTTPVFDVALSRPSTSRPSHNRNPTPLDFDKIPQNQDRSPPKQPATQYELDPASTYQPRKVIPVNPSSHSTSHSTHPAPTEEMSFIEWDDDDSSRLQRMKQSFNFNRPHRPSKPKPIQTKSPDKQLNPMPRVQRSSESPQSTSPAYTYTPQSRSPTYDTTQQRPLPICVPASSRQTQYLPSNIPPHSIQSPPSRYPEQQRPIAQHIHHDNPPFASRPSYTSRTRPLQAPTYLNQTQHQYKHHTTTDREEEHSATNDDVAPKSNRFKKIIRGVAERVSMRDLRKEAAAGTRK